MVAAKLAPEPPNTRLSIGDYIADILLDARPNGTIYHWIVQRVGSAAIIQWGQEYTFEDAYTAVMFELVRAVMDESETALFPRRICLYELPVIEDDTPIAG